MSKNTTQQLLRAGRLRLTAFASFGVLLLACGGTVTGIDAGESGDSSSVDGQHSTAGTASIIGGSGGNGDADTGVISGGTSSAPIKITCASPGRDPATGLVTCAEGYVHRPVAITCGGLEIGGAAGEGGAGGVDPSSLPRVPTDAVIYCNDDPSVCAPFQYGYCGQYRLGHECFSGCATDQDCGPSAICLCNDPASPTGGSCVSGSCGTDRDCQPGYNCASEPMNLISRSDYGGYSCQTPADTCEARADCKAPDEACVQSDGHRACAISAPE
jgi:hypothetical protein